MPQAAIEIKNLSVNYSGFQALENIDTVFEEGMTFSFHPRRNLLPDVRTTGINENILITADGIERLSEPWDLHWRLIK